MSRIVLLLVALAAPSALMAQTAQSIPRAKFITDMDALFDKADLNNDGHLTRTEIQQYQRRTAEAEARLRKRAMFAHLDADKNGQLSPTEFDNAPTAAQAINPQVMLNRMDGNRDQKISRREHRAATLANFNKLDANKDGAITPAEMKAAVGTRP
jgi:Ca2+-binding EF-hand superfamily protein